MKNKKYFVAYVDDFYKGFYNFDDNYFGNMGMSLEDLFIDSDIPSEFRKIIIGTDNFSSVSSFNGEEFATGMSFCMKVGGILDTDIMGVSNPKCYKGQSFYRIVAFECFGDTISYEGVIKFYESLEERNLLKDYLDVIQNYFDFYAVGRIWEDNSNVVELPLLSKHQRNRRDYLKWDFIN